MEQERARTYENVSHHFIFTYIYENILRTIFGASCPRFLLPRPSSPTLSLFLDWLPFLNARASSVNTFVVCRVLCTSPETEIHPHASDMTSQLIFNLNCIWCSYSHTHTMSIDFRFMCKFCILCELLIVYIYLLPFICAMRAAAYQLHSLYTTTT